MPRSRSRSHSRSQSRSTSRGRRRSRSFSRSRSRSSSVEEGYRVHIADLGIDCSKNEIERAFNKYGPTLEVWLARNPPCFAFVVFRHKEDAEESISEMNGKVLCGSRVRVSLALPRSRGRRTRRGYDPNLRCYTCGDKGHFSRDCENTRIGGYGQRFYDSRSMAEKRSRSPYRRRSGRYSRSRSRSAHRSSKKSRSPSRSRSRSDSRSKRSRSRSRSRRRSRKNSKRSRSRSGDGAANGRRSSKSSSRSRSRS